MKRILRRGVIAVIAVAIGLVTAVEAHADKLLKRRFGDPMQPLPAL